MILPRIKNFSTLSDKMKSTMKIEDIFVVYPDKVVATGKAGLGAFNVGDKVTIVDKTNKLVAKSTILEILYPKAKYLKYSNGEVGITLNGLKKTDISRGMTIKK